MKTIEIFTAGTSNYVYQMKLIGLGLKRFKQKNYKYIYHVMIDNKELVIDQYKDTFKELESDDFVVDLLGSSLIQSKLSEDTRQDGMTMTYAKVLAPSLFPSAEKVLWLDCDLVVRKGGIEQLFNLDLKNYYVGAVNDVPMNQDELKNTKVKKYMNSGVMLMNLQKMREDGIANLLEQDCLNYPTEIKVNFHQQSILNYRFEGKVCWISPIFNNILYSNAYVNIPKFEQEYKIWGYQKPTDAFEDSIIIHWPGAAKPWSGNNFDNICPYFKQSKEFYQQLRTKLERPLLTYSHPGLIGDMIYPLNFCIELADARGDERFNFHIQTNVPYKPNVMQIKSRKNKTVRLTKEQAEFIAPLLEAQPYIEKVTIGDEIPAGAVNLDVSKMRLNTIGGDMRDYVYQLIGYILPREFWKKVIAVEPNDKYKNKILFTLSERYVNCFIDYKQLEQFKDDLVFIGSEQEYKVFCQKYWVMDYAGKMNSLLEISQLLEGAKGYVGNQTGIFSLAEQLKVPRLLMSGDYVDVNGQVNIGPKNVLPQGGLCRVCTNTKNLIDSINLLKKY